ncbi:MAG: hypothetical protein ISR65_18145 [Bacteriovoracaceae bacterium]|nr:hypothetical protein [Bacteriovoracaceae bacterium]
MKNDLFQSLDYREIIKFYSRDLSFSQKELSNWARVHTSYFSRVMKNEADFSSSQLYNIAQALHIEGSKLEYFLILGEIAHSTDIGHKKFLQEKLSEARKKIKQLSSRIKNLSKELSSEEITSYFQEVITTKVHMLLTMTRFRKNLDTIVKELSIDKETLKLELRKLQSLGLITYQDNKVKEVKKMVHLPEEHPISRKNHLLWRLETVHKLGHKIKKNSDYHFSASFSATEVEKEYIKNRFKDFIVEAQQSVSKATGIFNVYHIGFDLY